mmetsp:Transcript_4290/g.12257  ORF Transcript_4290/g.12257 Transcript_4290/m.12257 type:complete len:182 (-) Transcript_4290:152-697(-)
MFTRCSITAAAMLLMMMMLFLIDTASSFSIISRGIASHSSVCSHTAATTTQLFSEQPRQPRRMLKKRRKRNKNTSSNDNTNTNDDFPWDTVESRPIVSSISKEYGEDYWIDQKDIEREQQRKQLQLLSAKKVSKEKLMDEVVAPYKQNWIGYFSLLILTLTVIVIKFPELLNTPLIAIPDL